MDNANSQEYLEKIKIQVIENLKRTTFAPSVQMTDVPRDPEGMDEEADHLLDDLDEDEHKDQRYTKRRWDKYVEKEGELSDSEDEEENESNGLRQQPGSSKRRNITDFRNPDAVIDDEDPYSGVGSPRDQSRGGNEDSAIPDAEENISARSSNANFEESGASSEAESVEASPTAGATNIEEDVEMADESLNLAPSQIQPPPDRPQEATPPVTPPDTGTVTAPTAQQQAADSVANDGVDEGDTIDDPEVIQERGNEEPENEDLTAELKTEVTEEVAMPVIEVHHD